MPSADGFGQVWRWPLYTPRRFFSCVAVVLALIAVSNMVLGGHGSGTRGQPVAPATSTPTATPEDTGTPSDTATGAPSTAPAAPGPGTPSITPTSSPKPAGPDSAVRAAAVALAFTRAWADHDKPATLWLAGVTRYADPEFAAQLKSTDPANVPASRVIGQPRPVSVFYASAAFEVPTDSGIVIVQLVSDGRTWRVVDIHPKQ